MHIYCVLHVLWATNNHHFPLLVLLNPQEMLPTAHNFDKRRGSRPGNIFRRNSRRVNRRTYRFLPNSSSIPRLNPFRLLLGEGISLNARKLGEISHLKWMMKSISLQVRYPYAAYGCVHSNECTYKSNRQIHMQTYNTTQSHSCTLTRAWLLFTSLALCGNTTLHISAHRIRKPGNCWIFAIAKQKYNNIQRKNNFPTDASIRVLSTINVIIYEEAHHSKYNSFGVADTTC
jgi:hypothetical protein